MGELGACYFCGDGPDSAEHVYGDCRVVRTARRDWGNKLGCNWTNTMDSAMLTFRPVTNKAYASGIVCFNWAVWSERSEYLPTLGWVPKMASEVNRTRQQNPTCWMQDAGGGGNEQWKGCGGG